MIGNDDQPKRPEFRGFFQLPPEEQQRRRDAGLRRGWDYRWSAPTIARVVDPTRGTVVVPSRSKYAALLCAAEVWGCRWTELDGAQVMCAQPGDVAVKPRLRKEI